MHKKYPPQHFLNREMALLAFNHRVLAQAENPQVPLLERLKYLCIVSSNLDEFFEVRLGSIKEKALIPGFSTGPDGLTVQQIMQQVSQEAHQLVTHQYAVLNDQLIPALAQQGIRFFRRAEWNDAITDWIADFFRKQIMPVLTPIGLDPAHPFPRLLNKSLNFMVELRGKDAFGREASRAIVQAPRILPRPVRIPPEVCGCPYGFVYLSSIIHAHIGELFGHLEVLRCHQFRVTRNSDLSVDDEDTRDLRISLQGELLQRHFGDAVRIEVSTACSPELVAYLLQQFKLTEAEVYRVNGLVNLVRLMDIPGQIDRPDLKFPAFIPGLPKRLAKPNHDLFSVIREGDLLLHHPYQSFKPVIDFVRQAASDPDVVVIKQTIYRTGMDSELMEALIHATRMGKQVTAVVELMARFDEEANINWASKLEDVGAHVVYGVVGYKTHAKMLMVVRREQGGFRRYVHLGTGNYHPRTTRLYTDFGLFTCNPDICHDVDKVFSQITSLGNLGQLRCLWQSPFSLHQQVIHAIQRETEQARAGLPAKIIAKMNSLLEPEVISALYVASQAGVQIELIVRGACTLRPGVAGLSDNIRVRSIIGRFLEHPRIFYFHNNGAQDVYLSSADWMDRNFFRRIEICFPLLDKKAKQRVINEGLKLYLQDNCQAWDMDQDGRYQLIPAGRAAPKSAQTELLLQMAKVATVINAT